MKGFTLIIFLLFNVQIISAQNNSSSSEENKLSIYSNILKEKRTCLISLPDSYNDSKEPKAYPLLILLDGYTLFKPAAGIVHFMSSDRNRNHLMPETIIVAIENIDRERDFTVTKIKTKRPNTMGGGRNFLNFIEHELIPFVDKNYRTKPFRTLAGHSLGGLLVINSYMDKFSMFNAYIAIDPSIWWDEKLMTEKVDSVHTTSFSKKIYLATANQGEANYNRNKKRHDALYMLLHKKAKNNSHIKLEYFENENHRSVPLIALYQGLKHISTIKQ